MLSRDLIASVIKTFFQELDDVRNGGHSNESVSPYTGMYSSHFSRDREWFIRTDAAGITTFFADDPIYKLEMLTELMYRDACRLADAEVQTVMYRKIIALYDVIDSRSMEFSVARMNRVQTLKNKLKR